MNCTHRRRARPLRTRLHTLLAMLVSILIHAAVLPAATYAGGCGITEPGACMDGMNYSFWEGLAGTLWSVDRMLLQLAYALDVFRVWLVETVFTSAYQVLTQIIDPLIVPFATVALLIGLLLMFLMPLVGHTRLMNVRHVLVWTLLIPVILAISGPMIVQVEQSRVGVGSALFTGISALAPGAIFGVPASDMPPPAPLYRADGNPCGTGPLARPGALADATALRMDDLAAGLLWADAEDIHCPSHAGPSQDLPDSFCLDPPDGPTFAACQSVGDMGESSDRQAAIATIKRGTTRLGLGIIPCLLAVGEAGIQLFFSLALMLVWIALPISLAFLVFADSASGIVILFQQGFGILKTTWAVSVILALLFAALAASAAMGNAGAYIGFSLGALLIVGYLLFTVALGTVGRSLAALNASVLGNTGINLGSPVAAAAGVVTGAAATAATGIAAYRQTGSGRYTAAAIAGRFKPVAQMGEVLAAWGAIDDPEVTHGLYAGQRSQHGARSMRLAMQADAQRTTADGVTFRAAADERRLSRQVSQLQRDPWRSLNDGATAGVSALAQGAQYVASGQLGQDVRQQGARAASTISDRWVQLKAAPATLMQEIGSRMPTGTVPPAMAAVAGSAAAMAAIHDRLAPDQRYAAYRLSADRQVRIAAQPTVPPTAQTLPQTEANIPRLLREGYTVQHRPDGTVSFWQDASAGSVPPPHGRRTPPAAPGGGTP